MENAFPAHGAARIIDPAPALSDNRPFRADLSAGKTPQAPFGIKSDFGISFVRFRILAPGAPEGTPFEKHRRPYARTVMDGKTLYVENNPADGAGIVSIVYFFPRI